MDKLKKNKKLVFLVIISFIAFLFGVFFITIISSNDSLLIKKYIETFFYNIFNNKIIFIDSLKETLFINFILVFIIFLLSISVIGLPIILFLYFFKTFCLGFALSSFLLTYKSKGIILLIVYFFPNEIIKYFAYTLLVFNSIKISKKIFNSIIKKEKIDFNQILVKYLKIIVIVLILLIISSLYETYIIPFIFSKFKFLIK